MCIIVVKEKDVKLPKREYLKNCFMNNDDGAGLMYTDNGDVVIEKGFMSWSDFEKRFDELCDAYNNFEGKSLVCHFRIGTQGKNDEHTCHPFPITTKHKFLRKTNFRTDIGMVHNGIISEFGAASKYARLDNRDSLLSDTQLFIRYCVASFKALNRNFYKNEQVMNYLDIVCGGKLAFLDKEDNVYTLGTYTSKDGVLYSNDTYSRDWYSRYSYYGYHDDYYYDGYTYSPCSTSYSNYLKDKETVDKREESNNEKIIKQLLMAPTQENEKDIEGNHEFIGAWDGLDESGVEELVEDGVLIPVEPGDTVVLCSSGCRYKVSDNEAVFLDPSDGIIYELPASLECLIAMDYGWAESLAI